MAHLKTAIKRLKTSKKANLRNRARTSELKTYEKKVRAAVAAADKALAQEICRQPAASSTRQLKSVLCTETRFLTRNLSSANL